MGPGPKRTRRLNVLGNGRRAKRGQMPKMTDRLRFGYPVDLITFDIDCLVAVPSAASPRVEAGADCAVRHCPSWLDLNASRELTAAHRPRSPARRRHP
jgi:hypothetical protein